MNTTPPTTGFGAKGASHNHCIGNITNCWWGNFRQVNGFEPLVMFWVNKPLKPGSEQDILQQFYKSNISVGTYELAGLIHCKLPIKPIDPNESLPEENIPDEKLPEISIDKSENASKHTSKRRTFPYGVYYIETAVTDNFDNKVWTFHDRHRCKIRSSRFYERWMLMLQVVITTSLKSLLYPQHDKSKVERLLTLKILLSTNEKSRHLL